MTDGAGLRGVVIRDAVAVDLDAVADLERRSFPIPWKREYFASEVGAPFRFNRVARDASGRLLGYVFCAHAGGEIHVHKIATEPAFRRLGLARKLMEEVFVFGERIGAEEVYLEVRESNAAARSFYAGLGFRQVGRRGQYYGDGEDALVLAWSPGPGSIRLDSAVPEKTHSARAFRNGPSEVAMPSLTEELKRELAGANEEFSNLLSNHLAHEKRLAELASKSFLSQDEEAEEKRLKKQKLALKDRMEEIAREYRARVGSSH